MRAGLSSPPGGDHVGTRENTRLNTSAARRAPCSTPFQAISLVLLCLAVSDAWAQTVRFRLVARETIEARLREYKGTNIERGARLKRMFGDAGCGEHVSEQAVKWSKAPNVICVLPGTSDRIIIVGAHFDRVPMSDGVADNWSGASLLPSLYEALDVEPRKHSYVFIGFTDEEAGLVGSRFYARHMTPEQVAATDAMINMDTLGLAPTEVWVSHSDKRLTQTLYGVSKLLELPLRGVNFDNVGSTDSESFRKLKIPRITIHSLTQKSENDQILHTHKDNLSAINLDDYYDTFHLVAVYLAFLDQMIEA
jgi:peptidase M28-like protein